jgi:uncharacterized protein YeaO (DUF488 family)
MAIRIVQLGSARAEGEGTRLGTVRRPPRGVKKSQFAAEDYFDAWLPELSPSAKLVATGLAATDEREWRRFERSYRAEMKSPAAQHLIEALARLSQNANFSVGCYCENYDRCHRSILADLLRAQGAEVIVQESATAPRRRAP